MSLTGFPGEAPRVPRGRVWSRVEELVAQLAAVSGEVGCRVELDAATMLTGRAALLGLERAGRTSANGTCRLLDAGDGWVAVNLARPSDVEAVAAIACRDHVREPWAAIESV